MDKALKKAVWAVVRSQWLWASYPTFPDFLSSSIKWNIIPLLGLLGGLNWCIFSAWKTKVTHLSASDFSSMQEVYVVADLRDGPASWFPNLSVVPSHSVPGWSVWPIEHGRGDVCFQYQVIKVCDSPHHSCFLRSLALGKARCHVMSNPVERSMGEEGKPQSTTWKLAWKGILHPHSPQMTGERPWASSSQLSHSGIPIPHKSETVFCFKPLNFGAFVMQQ